MFLFNKCYVGNVIHRRLHFVLFCPVHPQGQGPDQTLNTSPYSSIVSTLECVLLACTALWLKALPVLHANFFALQAA